MAVPKRKTTPSRRGFRRSHDSLNLRLSSACPECNELKLSHHMCGSCGFYRGRSVLN